MGGRAGEGARVSHWEAWERIGGFLSFYDGVQADIHVYIPLVDCDWDGNGHGAFALRLRFALYAHPQL